MITGVGYSGLVKRYSEIRFVRLIEGCDLSKESCRARSFLKAIKRLNPVAKEAPVAVELLSWIYGNFIDPKSVADLQLRASLMIGFFCLRISEIEDLRENDLACQSTEDGNALKGSYTQIQNRPRTERAPTLATTHGEYLTPVFCMH